MSKIVIATGSFNPITIAHRRLLEEGIELVNADKGLLVCTNGDYLINKIVVKKKNKNPFILSEDIRKEMIESLSKVNPKIEFGGFEIGGVSPSTERTLKSIMKKYPNSEFYFLVGADKLSSIPQWKNIDAIFSNMNLIVCKREGYDVEKIIEDSEFLTRNRNKIKILESSEDLKNVSSTRIRELYFSGEDYSSLMDKGPYEILTKIDKSLFKELSSDEYIKLILEYGGKYSGNLARLELFKENKKIYKEQFLNDDSKKISSEIIKEYNDSKFDLSKKYNTEIECKNMDASEIALSLKKEGLNPLILNSANKREPCYGYNKGTDSFETSLCFMSTLPLALYRFGSRRLKIIRELNIDIIDDVYPLDENYGAIYHNNVTFFRHNIDKSYALREDPFICNVITIPSLSNSKDEEDKSDRRYFKEDGYLSCEGKKVQSNKIRTIFKTALKHKHDSIVLSAFGCGYNNLKPDEIASLFKDILNEDEFNDRFKKIIFAIYEGEGSSRKIVGRNGKYKPFYDLETKGE